MSKREDSWATDSFSKEEKDKSQKREDLFPHRRRSLLTPTRLVSTPQTYIEMVNEQTDEEDDSENLYGSEQHGTSATPKFLRAETHKQSDRGPNLNTKSVRLSVSNDDSQLDSENLYGSEQHGTSATPKFLRAETHKQSDRGPNLNTKSVRLSITKANEEIDWNLPEPTEYLPPTPPPPPPPRPPPTPPPIKYPTPRPPTPPPTPPPSVGGSPVPETPRSVFQPTQTEIEEEGKKYDEKLNEINKSAWADKNLTKWVTNVVVKTSQRAVYKENTEQVTEGLKVVEAITERPLNKFFSTLTTLLPYSVVIISITAAVVNLIITKAEDMKFNVTCFVLDMIEVTFLSINFLLRKSSWYNKKTDEEKESFKKKQQLIDNVLAEVLMYPAILCSLIGIAVDTPFFPDNFVALDYDGDMGRLDLILITFDCCSLLYIYGSRMYIVNSFMTRLNEIVSDVDEGFDITARAVYTVVLNAILFVFMIILLGLHIYHENLEENKGDTEDVVLTSVSGYMIFATVVVPVFSIIVFVLANYYYILELMIKTNMHVLKHQSFRDSLQDKYGEVAQGIMGFAKANIHATPGRLRDIQSLTRFQRVFYVLREWWIDLLFFIWAAILILYCYFIYNYAVDAGIVRFTTTHSVAYAVVFSMCLAVFLAANYHTFAVVFVTNILIIPLFFSYATQAVIEKIKSVSLRDKSVKKISENEEGESGTTRPPTTRSTGLLIPQASRSGRFSKRVSPSDADYPEPISLYPRTEKSLVSDPNTTDKESIKISLASLPGFVIRDDSVD